MKISSSKNSTILLLIVLIATLLFALYYYIVLPKKNEVKALESSVSSLHSEITSFKKQISDAKIEQGKNAKNLFALRKQVPQTREIDQLLLNIEEIEYLTHSQILGISFNNYDKLVSESEIAPTAEETANANNQVPANAENTAGQTTEGNETTTAENAGTAKEGATAENAKAPTPVSTIASASLPPELKLITFNIEVEAPDYANLQTFIKEIEKLERIMHIDIIEYQLLGEEIEFEEKPNDNVTATVQVTTFYYEGE